jgi:methionyl-tRNA formyltransferase
MSERLKVAFAGTPSFAVPSLEALMNDSDIEVVKVFTQPDKPAGRGQALTPPPVKVFATENGVEVSQPKKIEKADLEGLSFLVVVAYGMILPSEVLGVPKFGCVNLHASLLPKLRGASPIQSAILSGEDETGVTFMQISKQLDSGAIFAQEEIEIGEKDAVELGAELAQLGNKFPEILQKISSGELQAVPQNEDEATFCGKIKKEDGKVDWEKDTSEVLLRKLRAFTGWPTVWTKFEGKILKLLEVQVASGTLEPASYGEVFSNDEGKIFVKTVDGAIELKKVQLEGKKAIKIEEFIKGNAEFVGAKLA